MTTVEHSETDIAEAIAQFSRDVRELTETLRQGVELLQRHLDERGPRSDPK